MINQHTITIDEMQRQMLLLALAKLSIEYPGWLDALTRLAATVPGGVEMFTAFREIHRDD